METKKDVKHSAPERQQAVVFDVEILMERVKGIEPSYSAWKDVSSESGAAPTLTRTA
ncbi:hypothetical protein AB4853_40015 [Bradyrhizobium sp. 1050_B9_N1_2]|uniref:hypothetical protein n=1 Tax=Bradyrhizobium sp. 1050_B9_N1_2 TaxID=3238688 RepID=UPI003EDC3191